MRTFQRLTLTFLTTLALTTQANASTPTELTLNAGTDIESEFSSVLSVDTIHKTGAGTVVLTNTENSIGTLDIQDGIVSIEAVGNIHATPAAVSFTGADGGTLAVTGTTGVINADVSSNSGNFDIATGTTTTLGTLTGGSDKTLTKTGAGTLSITQDNSACAAGITVSDGTLKATASNSLTELTTLNGGTLTLADTVATARQIALAANSNINVVDMQDTATLGGDNTKLTGSYRITKIGDGTLALSGDKSAATTGFTVSEGTLQASAANQFPADSASETPTPPTLILGNGSTLSVTGAYTLPVPIAVSESGTATLKTNGNTVTHSAALTGNGTLVKAGTGTLVLNGDKSAATTALTVNDGALSIDDPLQLPAGGETPPTLTLNGGQLAVGAAMALPLPITVTNDSTINTAAAVTQANTLIDGGGFILTKAGAGSLAFSTNISAFEQIRITAGSLIAAAANQLPAVTAINGGTLELGNAVTTATEIQVDADGSISVPTGTATLGNTLTGNHTLTKIGDGTLALSGDKSASATTITVNAGILSVGDEENFPAAVTVANGATLANTAAVTAFGDGAQGDSRTINMQSGTTLKLGANWAKNITVGSDT